MQKIYETIAQLALENRASKVVLFGSRARGDHQERSDIDIAVYGMPESNQTAFRDALDALPTLLDFDVVFVNENTSPALIANILKDGVTIMDKAKEKAANLTVAVARLQEAISDYSTHKFLSMRDGAIQRFEFCAELAWKATREYLIEQGYADINSPKSVMKQAYADGLLDNEEAWLQLMQDRNLTSHIYDETTADTIYRRIEQSYCKLLQGLATLLSNK